MSMHSTTSSPVRSPTRRPCLWASDAISTHQRSSGIGAHLGKRGGGERLRVEALEELIDIESELVLDDLERSLSGEAWHLMRDAIRDRLGTQLGTQLGKPGTSFCSLLSSLST